MNNQRKDQNTSLRSGERQIRTKLDDIEINHIKRYEEALQYIGTNDTVADLCCGIGYGSNIMSNKAKSVIGMDDSKETIDFANLHWKRDNITFRCGNVLDFNTEVDVIVAFESLEHLKDDQAYANVMKKYAKKRIIISVPEISVPLSKSHFHWRHYTNESLTTLFVDENWDIEKIYNPVYNKGKAIWVCFKRINK